MRKLLATAALIALIPHAYAASGSYVTGSKVLGAALQNATQFVMLDDGPPNPEGAWAGYASYCFSVQDGNGIGAGLAAGKVLSNQNFGFAASTPLLFQSTTIIANVPAGLHPADCEINGAFPAGMSYVWSVE